MPIHKRGLENDYVQISTTLAHTKDLSPEALGILVHMLSLPPEFNPTKKDMKSRVGKIGDPRFNKAYKELQDSGFLYYEKRRTKSNQFDHQWHASSVRRSKRQFQKLVKGADYSQRPDSQAANKNKARRKHNKKKKDDAAIAQILRSLNSHTREDVRSIFSHWNQDGFAKYSKWKRHIKLSKAIIEAIVENLDTHTRKEITDAIDNYAGVLLSDDCPWNRAWRLATFLTVAIDETEEREWYAFLPGRFNRDDYLNESIRNNKEEQTSDTYPLLTESIICHYGRWIGNPHYEAKDSDLDKFRLAATRMTEFFADGDESEEERIELLLECLELKYRACDRPVLPSHLASKRTWDMLMPQHLSCFWVPEDNPRMRNTNEEKLEQLTQWVWAMTEEAPTNLYTEYRRHHSSKSPH